MPFHRPLRTTSLGPFLAPVVAVVLALVTVTSGLALRCAMAGHCGGCYEDVTTSQIAERSGDCPEMAPATPRMAAAELHTPGPSPAAVLAVQVSLTAPAVMANLPAPAVPPSALADAAPPGGLVLRI